MLIAKVIGELVSTEKHASHVGLSTLVVQPLELDGSNRGNAVIAMDSIGVGIGEIVLLTTEGFSAMTSVNRPNSPIDMAVIGVIDLVEIAGAPSPAFPVRTGKDQ